MRTWEDTGEIWSDLALQGVGFGGPEGGLYFDCLSCLEESTGSEKESGKGRPPPLLLLLLLLSVSPAFSVSWPSSKLVVVGRNWSMAVDAEAQFHVLAVDDSLMDRKLIERLLKTSSFQG